MGYHWASFNFLCVDQFLRSFLQVLLIRFLGLKQALLPHARSAWFPLPSTMSSSNKHVARRKKEHREDEPL